MVEVQQRRSVEQHRLYWGMVRKVWDNLPEKFDGHFPSVERLSEELLIAAGHYEDVVDLERGIGKRVAKSIAFDKMKQEEFGVLFRAVVEVIYKFVIEDIDLQSLLDELDEMLT